jgi:hypothetical protein
MLSVSVCFTIISGCSGCPDSPAPASLNQNSHLSVNYTMLFLALNNHKHILRYLPVWMPTWAIALSLYGSLSILTYAPLIFGEHGMDLLKSLYPLILSLNPWSSHIIETPN